VFKLSDEAANGIILKGLAFFEGATKQRQYQSDSHESYLLWRESPLPSNNPLEANFPGRWQAKAYLDSGLECAKLEKELLQEILKAADKPGSFYTTKHESALFVIPKLKLIVLSWFG